MTVDPGQDGVPASSADTTAVRAHLDQLEADVARIRSEVGLTDRRIAVWAMQLIQANGAELLRRTDGMCEHQIAALAYEIDRYGHLAPQVGGC